MKADRVGEHTGCTLRTVQPLRNLVGIVAWLAGSGAAAGSFQLLVVPEDGSEGWERGERGAQLAA